MELLQNIFGMFGRESYGLRDFDEEDQLDIREVTARGFQSPYHVDLSAQHSLDMFLTQMTPEPGNIIRSDSIPLILSLHERRSRTVDEDTYFFRARDGELLDHYTIKGGTQKRQYDMNTEKLTQYHNTLTQFVREMNETGNYNLPEDFLEKYA